MSIVIVVLLAIAVFVLVRMEAERPPLVTVAHRSVPSPIVDALASDDESEVLAALDEATARGQHVPTLVLYHPNPAIVRHALRAVEPRREVMPYLLAHRDAMVRATAQQLARQGYDAH